MSGSEIIDEATLAGFFDSLGGDADFLSELLEAYWASTPGLFATMRQAVATGEAPALQRAAHSLKTGSASFGALAFAARCKEVEDMGKMGVLDRAEEKIGALEVTYAEVVAALQAWLERARLAAA